MKIKNNKVLNKKEIKKEYDRMRYLKDRKKILKQTIEYSRRNKKKIKEYQSSWYQENKEKVKTQAKKWAEKYKEKVRISIKKYRQSQLGKIANRKDHMKRRLRETPILFTINELKNLITRSNHCFYCGKELNGSYEIDHKRPLSRGGFNMASNLVVACPKCNHRKHTKTAGEFLKQLELEKRRIKNAH